MIRIMVFDADGVVRSGGAELLPVALDPEVAGWIDLVAETEVAERLLHEQGFHPLAIEDTFTLHHQPRVEEYADHLFVIVRGIDFNSDRAFDELQTLKLAAFLRSNLLITIHRAPLRSVRAVRSRSRRAGGRCREGSSRCCGASATR